MRIAVTGASGFIGTALIPLLTAQGHSLRLLTRGPLPVDDNDHVVFVPGDLLDENSLTRLVAGAEVVIHLAAMISMTDQDDAAAFRVNTEGTRLLLAAAQQAGVRRFIYLGSVTAFEQAPYDQSMDEGRGAATAQPSSYTASKVIAQAAALACNASNFEVIVLAPTAVTGPFDERPSLLGKAMIQMYQGKLPALFPGGVDLVDVRDVAAAIVSALTEGVPGKVYLLSGQWLSLKMLNAQLAALKGKNTTIRVLPLWLVLGLLPFINLWARLTGSLPYYTRQAVEQLIYSNQRIDHSRAAADLNFKPRPFAETQRDQIEWFRQNGYLDH